MAHYSFVDKVLIIHCTSVYLPMQVRKMLYSSFVIPHLDYCSTVWHDCGAVLPGRVERTQNYALRVILNKNPSRNDTMEMHRQVGLHSLECRRLNSTLVQVHRCLHGRAPQYLSCKFATKESLFASFPATRGLPIYILGIPTQMLINLLLNVMEPSNSKCSQITLNC